MPITLEARRDFVDGVARLSLWLGAQWASKGEALGETLTVRTNLYRLSSLYDGKHHPAQPEPGWSDPHWDEVLAGLRELYERQRAAPDTAAFEDEGLRRLWPLLEARLARDVEQWPKPADRPFGFFTFAQNEKEARIHLHLFNPFVPQSPFSEPRARAEELSRMLDAAVAGQPALASVHCGSWLNSFKPFLDFFPPEYAASAKPPGDLRYHYGWWGQFMDRTGGFHRRNGQHVRATGTFPFPCVGCQCSLKALRVHLKERFDMGRG